MGSCLACRARPSGPQPQSPADVAGTEAPTAAAQEQRPAGARGRRLARELRAGPLEVVAKRGHRGLSDRHEAGLTPLALDPHLLAVLGDLGQLHPAPPLGPPPPRLAK